MTNTHVPTSSPDQDEERTGASKRIIASAVVVAAIAALGIVLSVTNLLGGKTETPAPATAPSPSITASGSATTSSAASEPSVCGLTGVKMSGTVAAAPDATWTLVGTTAAPAVAGEGPGVSQPDGARYCFAHTPTGAVVAAANFVALGATQAIFEKVVDHSVAQGLGREALKAQGPAGDGGVRVQVTGFRLLTYDSGKSATVDIAIRTSRGALAGQVYDLLWENGDWKMRVNSQGALLTQLVQLPDLSGYVLWSGA